MSDKVRYEADGSVVTVTIDRPKVRNAMDREVFEALLECGLRAAADEGIRAVVVVGEGETFSSGIDTSVFTDGGGGDTGSIDIARLQRSFTVYEQMPKPTIAAVAGPAFGAGFQLAAACDLRVVAPDVALSVMEVKWGILPDLGGTQRLPRLIGLGRAKELAFTARTLGAQEALDWGLANRLSAPGEHLSEARAWAAELAAGPPLALAGIKRLANSAFDMPVVAGLDREAASQRRILRSSDFIEAVTARVQKRTPRFTNR